MVRLFEEYNTSTKFFNQMLYHIESACNNDDIDNINDFVIQGRYEYVARFAIEK